MADNNTTQVYEEYRGVESLYFAKLLKDDAESISWDTPKWLAGVAEISRQTNESTATHYYDNGPKIVIKSTSGDDITVSTSVIPLEIQAAIGGSDYDEETGAMFEGGGVNQDYFALLYKAKTTNGKDVYVARYKGTFSGVSDTTHHTEDDSTDANGQEVVFHGVETTHKFTKDNKARRGLTVVDDGKADLSSFFTTVQTPDTLKAKV